MPAPREVDGLDADQDRIECEWKPDFSDYDQTTAKKRTRKELLLAEMEAVGPWQELVALTEI